MQVILALLVEFLPTLDSSILLQLFHKTFQAQSNIWLWVSASVSVSCWVEPLRGQLCWSPICKHNRVSLIVSGIGSCLRDWFLPMGWVSSWASHSLAIPSVFAPQEDQQCQLTWTLGDSQRLNHQPKSIHRLDLCTPCICSRRAAS